MCFRFREFGRGHESIKTISRCMNMTKPVTQRAFNLINDNLNNAYLFAGEQSTQMVAKGRKKLCHAEMANLMIRPLLIVQHHL